ncbi:MAG: hypothetical protein SGJ20_15990 [Planctomycetota bacterium]|nr:hypothetical protein [Planctomycetota bacterium]
MEQRLSEYCDSHGVGLRIDRAAGLLRGVKLLGRHSRNGREYPPATLTRAAALYEGVKVNVNHPKGNPQAPRDYQDRIGAIQNVHARDDGLFGDLRFNPKHPLAEQLLWDAEHAPHQVGLSHHVQARTARRGETVIVEEILAVHGVDLVADPATTRGLFEQDGVIGAAQADGTVESANAPKATASEVAATNPLATMFSQSISTDGATAENASASGADSAAATPDLFEQLCREQAAELQRLRQQIDQQLAGEAAARRRATVQTLLSEYRLPDPATGDAAAKGIVSESFLQTLFEAPNEATVRSLIQERAELVEQARRWQDPTARSNSRPISREQSLAEGASNVSTVSDFVRAVRSLLPFTP